MLEQLFFEHNLPVWLIIVGLCVAVGAAVFSALRFLPPNWSNGLIILLRLAFIALLGWCLLMPQLRRSLAETIKPRFLVLIDTSASMAITPSKTISTNRWMVTQQVLKQPWAKRLTAECQVDVYPFDREAGAVIPLAQAVDLKPQGQGTLIRESLRKSLERYRGQNLAGVLLLTDGLDTREVQESWVNDTWPCPIYTVRLEPQISWEGEPDVHVDSVNTPRRVVVGWDTKLTAIISGQGAKGEAFNVQLQKDGMLVEELPTQLPPEGGTREVSFHLDHPAVGNFVYTVTVPPLAREVRTNDNAFSVNVQVVDSKNRALYVDGVPRWESKYLIRALKANKNITPLCFVQGPNQKFITFGDRGNMTLDMTDQQLTMYKIVIIGDLKAEVLGEQRATALLKFVENGGSLILLGGPNAWGQDGFTASALNKLLPIQRPWATPSLEGSYAVALTDEGRTHAIFSRGSNSWQNLPPVLSYFGGAKLSAGAVSLVEVKTDNGGVEPLIVAQKYGQGKVAIVLTDSLWRWQMNPGQDVPFTRFWTSLMEWMSPSETEVEKYEMDLFADVDQLYLDESIGLRARLSSTDNTIPANLKVVCELQKPDNRTLTLDMASQTVTVGSGRSYPGYGLDYRAEIPGLYKALARVEIDGRKVESAPYSFFIKAFTPETTPKPMNSELLKALSMGSGGRFLEPEEVSKALSEIKIVNREEQRLEFHSLWQIPWVVACLMVLLALEWIMRKIRNLA